MMLETQKQAQARVPVPRKGHEHRMKRGAGSWLMYGEFGKRGNNIRD